MTEISVNAKEQVLFKSIIAPLAVIILGAFMVVFDSTAMNVVIPRLIGQFDSTYNVVQWVITGYLLAEAAVIPLTGWLSDRFGMKRIFLLAIAVFTVGSLLCALAQGIEQLVIFRIIQGLGGGMVIPIMFAYTFRLSPPDQVGKIMGMVIIPIMLAPALGPVISGLVVDTVSWHWIFVVNVPIGILTIWIGISKLPAIEKQTVAALDITGTLLAPIAFAGLCYGVSEGAIDWDSAKTLAGLTIGGIALLLFVIAQLCRSNPLLELRVFGTAGFTRNILVLWIAVFAQFGTLFLIPQILQNVRGYSAFETGLIMLPYAVFAGISNQFGGRLFDKFGARPVAISGLAILSAGLFLTSQITSETSTILVILLMILIGSSVGFCVMPLHTNLLKIPPQHLISRVSSLASAIQQVVVSFAISGLATILMSRFRTHNGLNFSQIEAWSYSFRDTFLVLTVITLLGVILGFLIRITDKES